MSATPLGPSRIAPSVARKLGYYVYVYVNPLDESVFYVGKGKNGRALAHLRADERKAMFAAIRKVREAGKEPRIDILAHGLPSADVALKVEAAAIDLLGVKRLANAVRGHGVAFGRMPVEQVIAHYTRRKAEIREPAVLIRITRAYHYGISDVELYDATRSAWKVGEVRHSVKYAFAVFEGVVREVYRITGWLPAGSTFNVRFGGQGHPAKGRSEFVGVLAESEIRRRYVNRYVGHLFSLGAQNPISYVNLNRRSAAKPAARIAKVALKR